MKFYHGFKGKELLINKNINSRYGFPCLFFSTEIELANQYSEGNILTIEYTPSKEVDFNSKVSYSLEFRNLILKLRNEHHISALIKNVYDRENENKQLIKSDILVIFVFPI